MCPVYSYLANKHLIVGFITDADHHGAYYIDEFNMS